MNHRDGHREHIRGHGEARGILPGETTPKPRGEVSTGVGKVRGRDASPEEAPPQPTSANALESRLLRELRIPAGTAQGRKWQRATWRDTGGPSRAGVLWTRSLYPTG